MDRHDRAAADRDASLQANADNSYVDPGRDRRVGRGPKRRTSRDRDREASLEAGEAGPDADPEQVARAICLRQLTLGPRTKAQLARAMARRNVPEPVAERVLDRFQNVGLVDDAAFAAAWVDSRHAGRGLGRRALAHELRQRGVADPVVRGALDGLDPEQELAAARRLAATRLPAMRGLDPRARARRLGGLLARKGYPASVAYRVIQEALGSGALGPSEEALPSDGTGLAEDAPDE